MYLVLAGVVALGLLGYLYFATVRVMERQTAETIQAEITGLREQYRAEGLERLSQVIAQRSAAQPNRESIYLLTDPSGRPVAGNLDRWPDVEPGPDNWMNFTVEVSPDGETVEQRRALAAVGFALTGGFRLLVGREVEDRLQVQTLIKQALSWGLALISVLVLAGIFLIRRGMLGRVNAINRIARQIMAGDLSQRIALKGSRDEFDQLAANLNAMLDQIERLPERAAKPNKPGEGDEPRWPK
jgi:methyl-accepting chemotaxis protein